MQAGLDSVSQGSIIYFGAGETPAREPVSHPIEHKSLAGDPGLPPHRAQIARRGPRFGDRRYPPGEEPTVFEFPSAGFGRIRDAFGCRRRLPIRA